VCACVCACACMHCISMHSVHLSKQNSTSSLSLTVCLLCLLVGPRACVLRRYEGAFVADKSEQARQHEDGDLPPKKDTFKDLFEDLVGKPEMPAEEGDDAFDFEAGLDELMDDE